MTDRELMEQYLTARRLADRAKWGPGVGRCQQAEGLMGWLKQQLEQRGYTVTYKAILERLR